MSDKADTGAVQGAGEPAPGSVVADLLGLCSEAMPLEIPPETPDELKGGAQYNERKRREKALYALGLACRDALPRLAKELRLLEAGLGEPAPGDRDVLLAARSASAKRSSNTPKEQRKPWSR